MFIYIILLTYFNILHWEKQVVFLDLDMIVMRNIDELFELRPPAAMSTVAW